MTQLNRRNYTRIQMVKSAQLIMPDNTCLTYPIKDISLAGLQLAGSTEYPLGIYCTVILEEHLATLSCQLTFTGRICRKEDGSIGIQLIGTDQKTFDLLQTIIMYKSDDPVSFCEELTDNYPFDLYQNSEAMKSSAPGGTYTF